VQGRDRLCALERSENYWEKVVEVLAEHPNRHLNHLQHGKYQKMHRKLGVKQFPKTVICSA